MYRDAQIDVQADTNRETRQTQTDNRELADGARHIHTSFVEIQQP